MHGFLGQRVTVMGLGLHGGGLGVVRFLMREGADKIIVTDLRTKEILQPTLKKIPKSRRIHYILGAHRLDDFKKVDAIIKNPGVPLSSPYLKAARRHGVPILSDMGIFFERVHSPIIGITGTKGKSTTATLVALLLRARFRRILLAGNIRKSVLDIIDDANRSDAVVLELSSFQLEDLAAVKRSPNLAIITNIFPDHLNRHKTMREYRRVKSLIGTFQNEGDTIIIPRGIGLEELVKRGRAKLMPVTITKTFRNRVAKINPALQGHMADAAALAIATAQSMGVSEKDCYTQLAVFKSLGGRMEPVRVLRGIAFINDTTATTPGAAAKGLALIRRHHRGVILIAGGSDKNLPYAEFGAAIKKSARFVVLLPGSATEKLVQALGQWAKIKSIRAASMEEAVRRASEMAKKGEAVLLSPGAASFGLFNHEFHRGSTFVSAVKKLT